MIVFDKSRSMQSYLKKAKEAVNAVLDTLGPNDRVCPVSDLGGGNGVHGTSPPPAPWAI